MTEESFDWPEEPENEFDWPDEAANEIQTALIIDPESIPEGHCSGFIAVVGRPNVGKSTLMNAYLGQKVAIVSPKAQTTRNRILGILTLPKAQLIFIDTPGIHEPHHRFGEYMVETARQALPDADVILWLVDGSVPPQAEDQLVAQVIGSTRPRPPVILAVNKVDAFDLNLLEERQAEYMALLAADQVFPISATAGDNRKALLNAIIELLPEGPRFFPEDQITDQHTRFIAGEMIREAALQILRQEIPHALAVEVEEFKPRSETMTYISATIAVERESQKPIVIGQGGKTLKLIGQRARAEIEPLVGTKVFLDLRVKVTPQWRQKTEELKRLGYSVSDRNR
jgi:GTP-binding protein Era